MDDSVFNSKYTKSRIGDTITPSRYGELAKTKTLGEEQYSKFEEKKEELKNNRMSLPPQTSVENQYNRTSNAKFYKNKDQRLAKYEKEDNSPETQKKKNNLREKRSPDYLKDRNDQQSNVLRGSRAYRVKEQLGIYKPKKVDTEAEIKSYYNRDESAYSRTGDDVSSVQRKKYEYKRDPVSQCNSVFGDRENAKDSVNGTKKKSYTPGYSHARYEKLNEGKKFRKSPPRPEPRKSPSYISMRRNKDFKKPLYESNYSGQNLSAYERSKLRLKRRELGLRDSAIESNSTISQMGNLDNNKKNKNSLLKIENKKDLKLSESPSFKPLQDQTNISFTSSPEKPKTEKQNSYSPIKNSMTPNKLSKFENPSKEQEAPGYKQFLKHRKVQSRLEDSLNKSRDDMTENSKSAVGLSKSDEDYDSVYGEISARGYKEMLERSLNKANRFRSKSRSRSPIGQPNLIKYPPRKESGKKSIYGSRRKSLAVSERKSEVPSPSKSYYERYKRTENLEANASERPTEFKSSARQTPSHRVHSQLDQEERTRPLQNLSDNYTFDHQRLRDDYNYKKHSPINKLPLKENKYSNLPTPRKSPLSKQTPTLNSQHQKHKFSTLCQNIIEDEKNLEYNRQELALRPDYNMKDNYSLIVERVRSGMPKDTFVTFLENIGVEESPHLWNELFALYGEQKIEDRMSYQEFAKMLMPVQKEYKILLSCRVEKGVDFGSEIFDVKFSLMFLDF
jgi:hypothetical protein